MRPSRKVPVSSQKVVGAFTFLTSFEGIFGGQLDFWPFDGLLGGKWLDEGSVQIRP